MKNLISLAALIFISTALYAQENISTGIKNTYNHDKFTRNGEFFKKYSKIQKELNLELFFTKNVNGTIWVNDSIYSYNGNINDWDLKER